MEISSHILKLTGKAELPEEIKISENYHVSLDGSVIDEKLATQDDGTFSKTYTFKPIKIDLLDHLGNTLKLKDPRNMSQRVRSSTWKVWTNEACNKEFDLVYEQTMILVIRNIDRLVLEAISRLNK